MGRQINVIDISKEGGEVQIEWIKRGETEEGEKRDTDILHICPPLNLTKRKSYTHTESTVATSTTSYYMIVLQLLTILYYTTLAIYYILHYTIPYYTILCVLMLILYCYLTRVVFTTGCTVIMNCKLIVDMLIGTAPHMAHMCCTYRISGFFRGVQFS